MAVSVNTGGDTLTDGTEKTLATITAAGTYVLVVDLGPMVNGDVIEFRIKTKVRTGSTAYEAYYAAYAHAQGNNRNKYSLPVPSPFSFAATIKRAAGTDHTYNWSIYAL